MKHLLELCAICFSVGKVHPSFLAPRKVGEIEKNPHAFGNFLVRQLPPLSKKCLTYSLDQNVVFKFHESWSQYASLNALKAVWRQTSQ